MRESISLNKLILGTVQFGCQYGINSAGRPTKEMVSEILAEAYKVGVKKLDTSSAYGKSELMIGECIPAYSNFDIVSKFPKGIGPITKAIEASLRKLRTNKLYGYLLHHFGLYKEMPSLWDEFKKLMAINDYGINENGKHMVYYNLSQILLIVMKEVYYIFL